MDHQPQVTRDVDAAPGGTEINLIFPPLSHRKTTTGALPCLPCVVLFFWKFERAIFLRCFVFWDQLQLVGNLRIRKRHML